VGTSEIDRPRDARATRPRLRGTECATPPLRRASARFAKSSPSARDFLARASQCAPDAGGDLPSRESRRPNDNLFSSLGKFLGGVDSHFNRHLSHSVPTRGRAAPPLPMAPPRALRILHGGPIAREVASHVAAAANAAADGALAAEVFELAEYPDAGLDIVRLGVVDDDDDDARVDARSRDVIYVLVVETAEFENPADESVTFIRDCLAASKKNRAAGAAAGDDDRASPSRWRIRRVDDDDVGSAAPVPVAYAVVAVGDTDAMPERAAFRSNQNTAADCNQAGALADDAVKRLGGTRVTPRRYLDAARDELDVAAAAWCRDTLLPAVRAL